MAARKLSLHKDTLTELSTVDLGQVVAGQESIALCWLTGTYPSYFAPCTGPETRVC
jgi:hypothetical protein